MKPTSIKVTITVPVPKWGLYDNVSMALDACQKTLSIHDMEKLIRGENTEKHYVNMRGSGTITMEPIL